MLVMQRWNVRPDLNAGNSCVKPGKMYCQDIADRIGERLHSDDPTQYKEKVWQRINELNGKPIPIGDLLDRPEKASVVRTFVGSLFLAREGRIDIIQKDLESPQYLCQESGECRMSELMAVEAALFSAGRALDATEAAEGHGTFP
jgi:hypothetical protein